MGGMSDLLHRYRILNNHGTVISKDKIASDTYFYRRYH